MTANHRLALVVAANPTSEFPDSLQALSSTSPDIENVAEYVNTHLLVIGIHNVLPQPITLAPLVKNCNRDETKAVESVSRLKHFIRDKKHLYFHQFWASFDFKHQRKPEKFEPA